MKYTEIKISTECQVSSSGDYLTEIYYKENGLHRGIDFLLSSEVALGIRGGYKVLPKYVIDEVLRQFRAAIENKTMKFFECNRDGVRRYENFRYHDMRIIAEQVKRWPQGKLFDESKY